ASISGSALLSGATRTVSASEKVNLLIDPVSKQIISGTFASKASASGLGSASDGGPVSPEPLPDELGDGTWTLSLNLEPNESNKYQGTNSTATVTLMTGQVYPFSVVGAYKSTTGLTKLVLKGIDAAK